MCIRDGFLKLNVTCCFLFGDFFFRGVWTRSFHLWCRKKEKKEKKKINPPWAEFWMSAWYICHSPKITWGCFLFQIPTPSLFIKHNHFYFCCFWGGGRKFKKKKNQKKNLHQIPLGFGMIFLNKKPTTNLISVNSGHFFFLFFPLLFNFFFIFPPLFPAVM